jgi:hypothetical protein
MKDETASGFDGAAVMHRDVRGFSGIEIELFEQRPELEPGPLLPDSDSNRAILIMDAHRDHGAFEARVRHSRHCQQELARQEGSGLHGDMMRRPSRSGKDE